MNPVDFCKYVFSGSILRDLPTPGYSSVHHQARDLWPQRFEQLKVLAARALQSADDSVPLTLGTVNLVCLSVDLESVPSVQIRRCELSDGYRVAEAQATIYKRALEKIVSPRVASSQVRRIARRALDEAGAYSPQSLEE